jgi:predicted nucleic acid-binding Zn ribbon protein
MARPPSSAKNRGKKRDWRTTVWYGIAILIALAMVISLVASAFVR